MCSTLLRNCFQYLHVPDKKVTQASDTVHGPLDWEKKSASPSQSFDMDKVTLNDTGAIDEWIFCITKNLPKLTLHWIKGFYLSIIGP